MKVTIGLACVVDRRYEQSTLAYYIMHLQDSTYSTYSRGPSPGAWKYHP